MKWIALFFALFILLIIVLADAGRLGMFAWITRMPLGDKAGHFILYGILTLLIDLTFLGSLPARNRILPAAISGISLALLIGLEELSQQFFTARSFDLVDLTASYLGVLFFCWVALRIKK
jgi:VanZ family protein